MLVEFASVVDAVRCAVAVQQAMLERHTGTGADDRIGLRIGVNLGGVIVEDDDLRGNGVNIVARIAAGARNRAGGRAGGFARSGEYSDRSPEPIVIGSSAWRPAVPFSRKRCLSSRNRIGAVGRLAAQLADWLGRHG
jgi:hypothetical protein